MLKSTRQTRRESSTASDSLDSQDTSDVDSNLHDRIQDLRSQFSELADLLRNEDDEEDEVVEKITGNGSRSSSRTSGATGNVAALILEKGLLASKLHTSNSQMNYHPPAMERRGDSPPPTPPRDPLRESDNFKDSREGQLYRQRTRIPYVAAYIERKERKENSVEDNLVWKPSKARPRSQKRRPNGSRSLSSPSSSSSSESGAAQGERTGVSRYTKKATAQPSTEGTLETKGMQTAVAARLVVKQGGNAVPPDSPLEMSLNESVQSTGTQVEMEERLWQKKKQRQKAGVASAELLLGSNIITLDQDAISKLADNLLDEPGASNVLHRLGHHHGAADYRRGGANSHGYSNTQWREVPLTHRAPSVSVSCTSSSSDSATDRMVTIASRQKKGKMKKSRNLQRNVNTSGSSIRTRSSHRQQPRSRTQLRERYRDEGFDVIEPKKRFVSPHNDDAEDSAAVRPQSTAEKCVSTLLGLRGDRNISRFYYHSAGNGRVSPGGMDGVSRRQSSANASLYNTSRRQRSFSPQYDQRAAGGQDGLVMSTMRPYRATVRSTSRDGGSRSQNDTFSSPQYSGMHRKWDGVPTATAARAELYRWTDTIPQRRDEQNFEDRHHRKNIGTVDPVSLTAGVGPHAEEVQRAIQHSSQILQRRLERQHEEEHQQGQLQESHNADQRRSMGNDSNNHQQYERHLVSTGVRSPRRQDFIDSTFWVLVWPCLGETSYMSKPIRVLVNSKCVHFMQIVEKAAKELSCQPAPTTLFEPDGTKVDRLQQLRPNQHLLMFPSGGYYKRSSVPTSLLESMIEQAKLALGEDDE